MRPYLYGRFGWLFPLHAVKNNVTGTSNSRLNLALCQPSSKVTYQVRMYTALRPIKRPLIQIQHVVLPSRGYVFVVARVLRSVLKIRYLILGGAIGGGLSLQKTYEKWKESLPNIKWLDEYMPPPEKWSSMRASMIEFKDHMKDSIGDFEVDPRWLEYGGKKYDNFKEWFNNRLDEAIKAAESKELEARSQALFPKDTSSDMQGNGLSFINITNAEGIDEEKRRSETNQQRLEKLQDELIKVQLKYQKEIERLEKDNRDLRKQILLRRDSGASKKKVKKSLIDMYSDALDELSEYDSTYNVTDHLPRVVVVGDQSSGKTSVLEMIAQARIFPRGAGEMMTRAPVKVTLSEGPYHIAQFRDSSREFDLTKEADLSDLRKQVEIRMLNSVRKGKTVSNEVIAMTVKGPGLQRMVLVDLPGIISTVTRDMHIDTKDSIKMLCQNYMSNPNAIILCIQDGSVDAERSNVTDLVNQMDPQGKRTIFVLTKVDLAEENLTNPERIRRILQGKLFPMKALGYFAVVTGRGNKDDSIHTIKQYEERFFRTSKLFKEGAVTSSQVTTRNLSLAVSECFWKMVRETVEQQADAFKATRFNLETEWKNSFPRMRELDRDELFEKCRGEILDEIVNLSQVSVQQWEEALKRKLWEKVETHIFEKIYFPAAQANSGGSFNTTVDISLKHWADKQLPIQAVDVGWETLKEQFQQLLTKSRSSKDHDPLFDRLKLHVVEETMRRHKWEDKAVDMLRVIQLNALEDQSVTEKEDWGFAVRFLENTLKDRLDHTQCILNELIGPTTTEKWLRWRNQSDIQKDHCSCKNQLEKLIVADYAHSPSLSYDEITAVKKNLQTVGVDVDSDFIRKTWHPVYRKHFLRKNLMKTYECKKAFWMYREGLHCECHDVVFFWRIQQMLRITSNTLRQQVMNREVRRLEKEIKDVLEEYSQNREKKEELLTGRRVQLVEELKRVRHIQEKLEEFIQSLNSEK